MTKKGSPINVPLFPCHCPLPQRKDPAKHDLLLSYYPSSQEKIPPVNQAPIWLPYQVQPWMIKPLVRVSTPTHLWFPVSCSMPPSSPVPVPPTPKKKDSQVFRKCSLVATTPINTNPYPLSAGHLGPLLSY